MITIYADGELCEQDLSVTYVAGAKEILPALDSALLGHNVPDIVQISLTPEEAYGLYVDEDREIIAWPEEGELPEIGTVVEIQDGELSYTAWIDNVYTSEHKVVLNYNPPLAGKHLDYTITILSIN